MIRFETVSQLGAVSNIMEVVNLEKVEPVLINTPRILKSGMVLKKGGVTGAIYNPRLLELHDNGQLVYYMLHPNGRKQRKGGITLTATTRVEKRSGGSKRDQKFIVHHPLEGKEWYLWCHTQREAPPAPPSAFESLAQAFKVEEKEKDDKHKTKNEREEKQSSKEAKSAKSAKAAPLWPFDYLSNLNPPNAAAKKNRPSADSAAVAQHKNGKEEANEWCALINEAIGKCKKMSVYSAASAVEEEEDELEDGQGKVTVEEEEDEEDNEVSL